MSHEEATTMTKTPHPTLTPIAGASGILSAALVWFWLTSAQGKVYLLLAVLWCCGSDPAEAAIVLDHDPSFVAAVTCGLTISCIVTALWLIFQPGEKSQSHIKYDILRDDR